MIRNNVVGKKIDCNEGELLLLLDPWLQKHDL